MTGSGNEKRRADRLALIGSVALLALVAPAAAHAQAAPEQAPPPVAITAPPGAPETSTAAADNGDIVVVARRRQERLIDVPIAVTALNADQLAKSGAIDLSGIQGTVPNVNLVQGRGSTSNANIFIRGVGQPDALQTFDPAVGIYVDGVYMSRIQGALFSLFDVDHVEVLRGPQGTLYGKNTIGGAVNIVSRKPDLDTTHAAAELTYGSYNQVLANGYLSTPLVTDKVALSVAGVYDKRDGLVTDPLTGRKYNNRNTLAGRAILRAKPSEALEIILQGDYTRQRTDLTLGYPTAPLLTTQLVPPAVVVAVPAYPYGPYDFKASTSLNLAPGQAQRLDHWGTSLTANLDLGNGFGLTSISAYRKLRPDYWIDIDASTASLGDAFVGVHQQQLSQELQLKYSSRQLTGVFGLYYLTEKQTSHQIAYANDFFRLTPTIPISFTRFIDDDEKTDSYAAYGQATYNFTDHFSLTGGLRYTRETKRYNRVTTTASSLGLLNGITFRFPDNLPAPYNADDKVTFDAWTPSATLSYKPTHDTLLYVSAARGFKSGGFNGRVNSLADVTQIVNGVPTIVPYFKPETVWTYEAGAKGSFMGGRLTMSGDAFYSDYRDFQARVGGGTTTLAANGSFPVINAGKLRIWGLEYEATYRPVQPWSIRLSAGYLNAKYLVFNDGRRLPPNGSDSFSCNPTGQQITCKPAFAPPLTLSLATDYAIPLRQGMALTLGGDVRYVGKQYLSVDNRPGLTQTGYTLANAFAQIDVDRYYFRAMVKNIGNKIYKTDAQEFSSVGNIQTAYYGDPRTWQITAGVKF